MCNNHRVLCNCGQNQANLFFKNHILNLSVLSNIFCPECSRNVNFDAESMIEACIAPISKPQISAQHSFLTGAMQVGMVSHPMNWTRDWWKGNK